MPTIGSVRCRCGQRLAKAGASRFGSNKARTSRCINHQICRYSPGLSWPAILGADLSECCSAVGSSFRRLASPSGQNQASTHPGLRWTLAWPGQLKGLPAAWYPAERSAPARIAIIATPRAANPRDSASEIRSQYARTDIDRGRIAVTEPGDDHRLQREARVLGSQLAPARALVFLVRTARVVYTPVWATSRPEFTASVKAW
jgi:hypothetical protein